MPVSVLAPEILGGSARCGSISPLPDEEETAMRPRPPLVAPITSAPSVTRRRAIRSGAAWLGAALLPPMPLFGKQPAADSPAPPRINYNVLDYGATGDGTTPDHAAFQRAVDAAAADASAEQPVRVLVPGGRRYRVGRIALASHLDFHLAADAELFASEDPADYGDERALLTARDAVGLRLSGTGRINGHARDFMTHYDEAGEWWVPREFRPRLAVLHRCQDLAINDVTFLDAPQWTLHLVGCRNVLVDGVTIRNQLDVPNCDGIDPDHCRHVEIRRCHIECGDDAIVVKATRAYAELGGSHHIHVHDCVLETQDSGLKIGTETVRDITDVTFERCEIRRSCRACTIQLPDEGNVRGVVFRDIMFEASYHAAPWWGRGEAISLTAIPRAPDTRVGQISEVLIANVRGRAENSVRISGTPESRISQVRCVDLDLTFERWTNYPGAVWDNRPTTAYPALESHATAAFHVRYADHVELRDCRVRWGKPCPDSFGHALEAHDVTHLTYPGFTGEAAHPDRDAAIVISVD